MTHLILHKVRGEPAFDIAEELENGMWIIPTSGHRAYPYLTWPLADFGFGHMGHYTDLLPPNHPDHYSINDQSQSEKPTSQPTQRKAASRTPTLDDLD